jgi:hypothetical protein
VPDYSDLPGWYWDAVYDLHYAQTCQPRDLLTAIRSDGRYLNIGEWVATLRLRSAHVWLTVVPQ